MKKTTIYLLIAILINGTSYAQLNFNEYKTGSLYNFNDEFKLTRSTIFTEHKEQFGLTPDDEMRLDEEMFYEADSTDSISFGSTQSRYRQYYKNYPVEGKLINLLSKCDVVLYAAGSVVSNLNIDVSTPMSEQDALTAAMNHINPPLGFAWQNAGFENGLKELKGNDSTGWDSSATYYPQGKLIITKNRDEGVDDVAANYAFCWQFRIAYLDTVTTDGGPIDTFLRFQCVVVNNDGGTVLDGYNEKMGDYYTTGSLWTPYQGQRWDIETRTCTFCTRYTLADSRKIETYDYYDKGKFVKDNNNNWVESNTKTAASAHWGVERAYDFFKYKHGIWHNNYKYIFVNSDDVKKIGAHAAWTPSVVCNGCDEQIELRPDNGSSAASLEIMGHELTHGMIWRSGGLGKSQVGEGYALNEGFCDIFGLLTFNWYMGWTDWHFGEDVGQGRGMHTPGIDSPPSSNQYMDGNWYNGSGQRPYVRSGPLRKWFTHTSQGEWNWNPAYSGAGIDVAGRVAFIAMYWWTWDRSSYYDVKNATLAIARIHFGGECGKVWNVVDRAWADVGMGPKASCNPLKIGGPIVVPQNQVGDAVKPVKFKLRHSSEYSDADITLTNCTWTIPPTWEVTYAADNSGFTLENINGDVSSTTISANVTYSLPDGSIVNQILNEVVHIGEGCNGMNKSTLAISNKKHSENTKVEIFPNPASKTLSIIVPDNQQKCEFTMYDVIGKLVYRASIKTGLNTINLPVLANGMYIVKVKNATLNYSERVEIAQ